MGSWRTSAARASVTLWKSVRFSKAPSTKRCNSGSTLIFKPVVDLCDNHYLSRHCNQLRWIGIGPLAADGEQLQSTFTNFGHQMTITAKHNSSFGVSIRSSRSPLLLQTSISGKYLAREISSDVSKSTGHDEDIKVRDGDLDVEDDADSASLPLSVKSIEDKSDRELLWEILDNHKKEGEMISALLSFIGDGHTFTNDDAAFVISKLRRYGRYAQAAEILDWIAETKKFPWTVSFHIVRISVKGKLGKSIEVEKIFNDSPPELQTELVYNAVIKHFCERGMAKKASEWLDRLMKSGLTTHTFAFNRLLVLYKDKGMRDKVNEVLQAMDSVGIKKDIYTYNILMSIKGKDGDVAGIEKILDECKADPNVTVDAATHATLAGSYINFGFTEKAAAALEEAGRIGFPSAGNVDEVIATLWGKLGNKDKVLSLWEHMKQKPKVAVRTYVVMIETFGKLGMVDQAEALFHEMNLTTRAVQPRQFIALLAAYANNNFFDKAETLIASINSMELRRSSAINHYIVGTYLRMGDIEKALAVITEAKSNGATQLWLTTMVVLLNAAAEKGDIMLAEKLFDTIRTTYNQKNQAIYNSLLKAYLKAGVPADGFLERMEADKIPPSKETLRLMKLSSAGTTGSVHGTEDILGKVLVESGKI